MSIKIKGTVILAGAILGLAFTGVSQAQMHSSYGSYGSGSYAKRKIPVSQLTERQKYSITKKIISNRNNYNYIKFAKYLQNMHGYDKRKIRNCLRWSQYGRKDDYNNNPYIERALYDIAYYYYSNHKSNRNRYGVLKTEYPREAFQFCGIIPSFHESKKPVSYDKDYFGRPVPVERQPQINKYNLGFQ